MAAREIEPSGGPWLLRHSLVVVLLGISVTSAVAILGIFFAPHWGTFAAPRGASAEVVVSTRQSVRDSAVRLATGLGAITAGLLAWARLELSRQEHSLARRRDDLGEQAQLTERYTRAVEQLGHDSADVRLGGLYALERLGHDSQRDRSTITEVLSAYVREHTKDRELGTKVDVTVQAALTILGRSSWSSADLRNARLMGADLSSGDFSYARFDGADLTMADLSEARLTWTSFLRADLGHANLQRASMRYARLAWAGLEGARLDRADLRHAWGYDARWDTASLRDADLRDVDMSRGRFNNAVLAGGNLTAARLQWASLLAADLRDATLIGTSLVDCDLSGAKLGGANLLGIDLTGANLTDVIRPEGFG